MINHDHQSRFSYHLPIVLAVFGLLLLLILPIHSTNGVQNIPEQKISPPAESSNNEPNIIEAVKKPPEPKTTQTPDKSIISQKPPKAVIITCADMVDEGLYESIKRRTEQALQQGATYIIYQIDTFGGRVDSAIEIYNYFMQLQFNK